MKDWLPPSEPLSVRLGFPVTRECPDQDRLPLFPGITDDVPCEPIPRIRTTIGSVHPIARRRARGIRPGLTFHVEVVPVDQRRLKVRHQVPSLLNLLFLNEGVIHDVGELMIEALRREANHPCMLCRESPLRPERVIGGGWRWSAASAVAWRSG